MRMLFTKRRCEFLAVILVMILLSGLIQPQLQSMRKDELLDISPPGEQKGTVMFTQALGAFRSIAIDALWMRAMDLQQNGKFFELAQLYDLICQMEPHFVDIWVHSAWNMAYNISVELPTWQERWSWVQKGISLLRDQAIPLNPREPDLYKELAWIYVHKIGDHLDNMHMYYKREMIQGYQRLLGDIKQQNIAAIASAPDSRKELEADEAVKALAAQLAEAGEDPYKIDLMKVGAFNEEQKSILTQPDNADAAKKLMNYLRKVYLKEKLRLDPGEMERLNNEYGKLDWRFPEVHALYWAEESIKVLPYEPEEEAIFYERMVYTAFKFMLERGRVFFQKVPKPGNADETEEWPFFMPDIRWVDILDKKYVELINSMEGVDKFSMENARKNWLKRASFLLFTYGNEEKARQYYTKFMVMMRNNEEVQNKTFEDFLREEVRTQYNVKQLTPLRAQEDIYAFVLMSLVNEELGNEDQADWYAEQAKQLHAAYEEDNADVRNPERWKITPLDEIYGHATKYFEDEVKNSLAPPEPLLGGDSSDEKSGT